MRKLTLSVVIAHSFLVFAISAYAKNDKLPSKRALQTVSLPSKEVLRERLGCLGIWYFMEKTNIVERLANKELYPSGVALAVMQAMSDYAKLEEDSTVFMQRHHIIKVILQEYPDAIKELEAKGYLKDEALEKKKSELVVSGKYDLFKIIQQIREVAEHAQQEVRDHGEDLKFSSVKKHWPNANPFYHKTEQGLYLSTENYPMFLHTPWGQVKIYGSGSYLMHDGIDPSALLTNIFFKHFTLAFERNVCDIKDWKKNHNPQIGYDESPVFHRIDDHQKRTQISQEDLQAYKNTDVNIQANYAGCHSIYKVLAFHNKKLPESQESQESTSYATYKETDKEWNLLSEMYDDEKREQTKALKDLA